MSLLYKELASKLKIQEKTPTISFIVPFPQIYKYLDDNDIWKEILYKQNDNSWNEILHKQKSILFCNIDTNNFYKWWNFAAIIDFKWKVFGRTYYYLNWYFYTNYFFCFALASISSGIFISNNILFVLSILFGFIYLIVKIRQCL